MRFGIMKPPSDDDSEKNGHTENEEDDSLKPLSIKEHPELEDRLGYAFEDKSWLERALTHRSAHIGGNKTDYERLEFLGDAVLDLAVAHLLLDRHKEAKEGELSKMRAALVNTTSLANIAKELDISPYIILSRGELANGGAQRPSILADVIEAVIGAIYREAGYLKALECIEKFYGNTLCDVIPRDPKTELQEALHAIGANAPKYLLEYVEGPEHEPLFVSVVEIDGQVVGRGKGPTKKASQQMAAEEALKMIDNKDEIDDLFYEKEEEED